MAKKNIVKKIEEKSEEKPQQERENPIRYLFPPRLIGMLADEVAKTLVDRLPGMMPSQNNKKKAANKVKKKIEHAIFLDTSAIIDGRIFDVIALGLLNGVIVITDGILLELKHIADSQDAVRRERGRKGLEYLERVKKSKDIKLIVVPDDFEVKNGQKLPEVDERIIKVTKNHRGKIITCDYNLEKKATIEGVPAINVNAIANALKVTAVPGD